MVTGFHWFPLCDIINSAAVNIFMHFFGVNSMMFKYWSSNKNIFYIIVFSNAALSNFCVQKRSPFRESSLFLWQKQNSLKKMSADNYTHLTCLISRGDYVHENKYYFQNNFMVGRYVQCICRHTCFRVNNSVTLHVFTGRCKITPVGSFTICCP